MLAKFRMKLLDRCIGLNLSRL